MKSLVKIIICFLIIITVFFLKNSVYKHGAKPEIERLDEIVGLFLEREGINPNSIIEESYTSRNTGRVKEEYIQKRYLVENKKILFEKIEKLKKELSENKFYILESTLSRAQDDASAGILIGKKKKPLYFLELTTSPERSGGRFKKARVALVLDDWGYNLENLEILKKIKHPITLSILPNLPYSQTISEFSRGRNIEVILHLPLESYNHDNMENNTICCNMEENEIIEVFNKDLLNVPYSRGVSNHMGSKATEDKNVMSIIFGQMKKKDLFFLDSVVTKKTACKGLAKKIGLKFAKRAVFLDNENDRFYIKSQLSKLAELAEVNGQAVGIGHDRGLTLEVISEEMENLEKKGVKFVFLSQLVN